MNFWRQTNHIMSYFKEENFRGEKRLPSSFVSGFLEVSAKLVYSHNVSPDVRYPGSQLECGTMPFLFRCVYKDNTKLLKKRKAAVSRNPPLSAFSMHNPNQTTP